METVGDREMFWIENYTTNLILLQQWFWTYGLGLNT